mmetsp:Transcript_6648/g.14205  ORF Transcript_6648/g.14205 Transcript_6648/m.14205 type:complete len:246 (+) Transcript_6648:853-1590(+)
MTHTHFDIQHARQLKRRVHVLHPHVRRRAPCFIWLRPRRRVFFTSSTSDFPHSFRPWADSAGFLREAFCFPAFASAQQRPQLSLSTSMITAATRRACGRTPPTRIHAFSKHSSLKLWQTSDCFANCGRVSNSMRSDIIWRERNCNLAEICVSGRRRNAHHAVKTRRKVTQPQNLIRRVARPKRFVERKFFCVQRFEQLIRFTFHTTQRPVSAYLMRVRLRVQRASSWAENAALRRFPHWRSRRRS